MRNLLSVFVLVCWTISASAADVSELIQKLKSKDPEVRRAACKDLGELGKEASSAIPALVKALKDRDKFVRRFACQALGSMGDAAKDVASDIAKLFQDDQASVRDAAVTALIGLGSYGIPELSKAVKGTTTDVQEKAIGALAKAGTAGLPALIVVIRDVTTIANLRRQAIAGVVSLGIKDARPAIPALTEAVKNPKAIGQNAGQFRDDAIDALGNLAYKEDTAAVNVLDAIVKDEKNRNMGLKNRCRNALKKINSRKAA